jgi:predicted CXXCH cytochrome family protein
MFSNPPAATQTGQSGVPLPDIARGLGDACVEDVEFMRRNHMKLLMHQRNQTMREGIRSKQYSLRECVACHSVRGPDAIPVTVADPNHFCRSCHDYAAVSIDCFQCHASRPEAGNPGNTGVMERSK